MVVLYEGFYNGTLYNIVRDNFSAFFANIVRTLDVYWSFFLYTLLYSDLLFPKIALVLP